MHVKEHIEFTHKVISNTSLQSEVGIAGIGCKDWVATKQKFWFFFVLFCLFLPLYLFFVVVFLFFLMSLYALYKAYSYLI